MNEKQTAQIQTLTRRAAEDFVEASFRNSTRLGSETIVIDVYADGGRAYLGVYTVYEDGQFSWAKNWDQLVRLYKRS